MTESYIQQGTGSPVCLGTKQGAVNQQFLGVIRMFWLVFKVGKFNSKNIFLKTRKFAARLAQEILKLKKTCPCLRYWNIKLATPKIHKLGNLSIWFFFHSVFQGYRNENVPSLNGPSKTKSLGKPHRICGLLPASCQDNLNTLLPNHRSGRAGLGYRVIIKVALRHCRLIDSNFVFNNWHIITLLRKKRKDLSFKAKDVKAFLSNGNSTKEVLMIPAGMYYIIT